MADDEDRPASPPLARGAYSINFDELDDSIDPFKPRGGLMATTPNSEPVNPFQSKSKLGSSPPIHEDINPFQSKSKLSSSPPTQEEVNPFQTKAKLSSSPPMQACPLSNHGDHDMDAGLDNEELQEADLSNVQSESDPLDIPGDVNPLQTKTKLGQSPPNSDSGFSESTENPFQSKTKLGHSPPRNEYSDTFVDDSNSFQDNTSTQQDSESVQNENAAIESPVKSSKGLKTRAKSQKAPSSAVTEDVPPDTTPEDDSTPPPLPKKVSSPRKSGLKKPKAKSKFKRPANFGAQNADEDVVIFSPPPQSQSANENEAQEHAPSSLDNFVSEQSNQMTVSEIVGKPSGLIDSVHDFGASDMPVEGNEASAPPHEAFSNQDAVWDMAGQMDDSQVVPDRETINDHDPQEEDVPDKATRRASEACVGHTDFEEDEEAGSMSSAGSSQKPASSGRSVARHPAARALQEELSGTAPASHRESSNSGGERMLYGQLREGGKPFPEGDEPYFDAPEFPLAGGAGKHKQGDSDGDHINMANKKQGGSNQDNIVQLVQVLKYSQTDWNKMKQELDLEHNARILNKEREWSKKLADRDKKIAYLDEQVLLLRSSNDDMKCVVTEFEKTIAQLQADKLKTSTESMSDFENVVKARDQALEDLQSVETAFSDLHQRYERTKGVVEGFKKNEDTLKKCVQDYQVKLKSADDKATSIRQQAEEKLAVAHDEMDKIRRSTSADVARLEAALKKADLKIQGLERSLDQKVQENSELTAICDELIAKVGD